VQRPYQHSWGVARPARGLLSHWLAGLGVRSLGSLLFAHPGFVRGEIEYLRLDSRHPLFQRVARIALPEETLWARRSLHQLGKQAVLVTEVFLPAIETLGV
jgi:chorismate--pyruvate lyase